MKQKDRTYFLLKHATGRTEFVGFSSHHHQFILYHTPQCNSYAKWKSYIHYVISKGGVLYDNEGNDMEPDWLFRFIVHQQMQPPFELNEHTHRDSHGYVMMRRPR